MNQIKIFACSLALLTTIGLTACHLTNVPDMYVSVGRAHYQTWVALDVMLHNYPANRTYAVGIFSNGAPRKIGTVTTDSTGGANVKIEYEPVTITPVILNVGLYVPDGQQLGPIVMQVKTDQPTYY